MVRELLPEIDRWTDARQAGDAERVALATVVSTWGSAPRPAGSKMLVSESGRMAGSVSGGCVEGAVVEESQGVLATGVPRLVSFGVADDDAFAVGLSCGGTLEVWIEALEADPTFEVLRARLEAKRPTARVTVLDGGSLEAARGARWLLDETGAPVDAAESAPSALLDAARDAALEARGAFGAVRRRVAVEEGDENRGCEADLFVEWLAPPPRLVVVGAVHVAIHLVAMARRVGFETIVVDPRTAFATAERFGHADALLHDWPDAALERLEVDANTFVVLLSHDLKLDVPALRVALPRARYVGALGSRKTQAKRLARAREAGIDEVLFDRIHNPVGLNLGGRRAEEMAVAILAEIVAVSHGRDARPLS